MRRHTIVGVVGALFLAVALAACGGSDATPTSTAEAEPTPTATTDADPTPTGAMDAEPTPTSTIEAEPTPTATSEPTGVIVAASIELFTHQDLTVEVGATVVWTNLDRVRHTTTSGVPRDRTGLWDSGALSTGEPFSFTFAEPGEYPYFCTIHPSMRATVTVANGGGGQSISLRPPTPTSVDSGEDDYY